MKIERTRIHFFSEVFSAVAILVPNAWAGCNADYLDAIIWLHLF